MTNQGPTPNLPLKMLSAGMAACVAEMFTIPLDTAKVRLQIQGEQHKTIPTSIQVTESIKNSTSEAIKNGAKRKYKGVFQTMFLISKEEGVISLYNGLVAGLHRQMCFASFRIGLYDTVKKFYIDSFKKIGYNGSSTQVELRICAGITTGGLAVTVAQPTDVVKVRMQAQNKTNQARYSGSLSAYSSIYKLEGVQGLWKGVIPNITRNAIVNAAELVSYDMIKEAIITRKLMSDNMPCHFVSAFGAGFCTTIVASPVDVVKTRYMNSGLGVYKGALHCAMSMWKEGGFFAFYKGFMPSFLRLSTWNIAMFVSFEQFKRFFARSMEGS